MNIKDRLQALPKVELHLHLDGSIRPETLLDLAQKDGINLPTTELSQIKDLMMVSKECNSLKEYLEKFKYPQLVMQSYENLERIAYELCEMVAQENVRYFEVRFAPQLHTQQGLSLDQVVEAVLAGLKRGEGDFNLHSRVILCAMRHQDVQTNMPVVELAAKYQDQGVVAIDLAGNEATYPVDNHLPLFRRAKELGVHITIHAGEAAGAESVAKALHYGAERIGHGVRSRENPNLVDWLVQHQIPLEVCPISNVQTKVVSSLANHPVKAYFDQGVKVTINTDNRTVSNTSLTKEYLAIMEYLNFTCDEIQQMIIHAAEAAFLPIQERDSLVQSLRQEMGMKLG